MKKIISSILLLSVIGSLLSPIRVEAATAASPVFTGDDSFTFTLDDTVTEGQVKNNPQRNLSQISSEVTLRLKPVSSHDSYIYGIWKNANDLNIDRVYELSFHTDYQTEDTYRGSDYKIYKYDFAFSYGQYGQTWTPQYDILKDLYNLNIKYATTSTYCTDDKKSITDFGDIVICANDSDSITIKNALKKLNKDWLTRAFITNDSTKYTSPVRVNKVDDTKAYFKEYTVDEYNNKSDANMTNLISYFNGMKNSEYLPALIWWYNTYYNPGSNIKALAIDEKHKIDDDIERFIIYCINGRPLDAKTNNDALEQEKQKLLSSTNGAYDITNISDWQRAAVFIHEGFVLSDTKYAEAFLDFDNLTKSGNFSAYEQAQIINILLLPNANIKATLKGIDISYEQLQAKFDAYDGYNKASQVSMPEMIMANSLSNILQIGEVNYSDPVFRMLTFEDRVNYLATTANQGLGIDETIKAFYEQPMTDYALHPDLSVMNIGSGSILSGKFTVKDSEAYSYMVSTMTEMYSISRTIPMEIDGYIQNGTISNQQKYVRGMLSMYNSLRLLDSKEAWQLWSRPYDDMDEDGKSDSGNYLSLANVYDKLQSIGAFTGLDTSIAIDTERPLGTFMDIENKVLSPMYLKGISYSSTYIPMSTNVYDPYVLASYEDSFLKEFHYIYGFHRKALYIDTNSSSASDRHNTGKKSTTRVATLKDLLNADMDITLYIDDNFYNANKLAELSDTSFDRLDNVDNATDTRPWYSKLWSKAIDNFEIDIYEQVKTAENTKYSKKLKNKVKTGYTAGKKANTIDDTGTVTGEDNTDEYVLTSSQIDDYLDGITIDEVTETTNGTSTTTKTTTYDSYNVLMSYALVSAVYRDNTLFNLANDSKRSEPVFISSPTLATITNTTDVEKGSILNYMLLKNLKANLKVGYNYNVDLNKPVYMDIYGNILTESGYVVVPAASNATLFGKEYSDNLFNMGIFTTYGKDYSLPSSYLNVDGILNNAFEKNEDLDVWSIKSRTVDGDIADYARLSTGDRATSKAIQEQFEYNMSDNVKLYNFDQYLTICLEVLRGAPIENIDKNFEGLNTDHRISSGGIKAAAKLEELNKALDSGGSNAILSIPNLAFMDNTEYIILLGYKLLIVIIVIILLITVYIDVVSTNFGVKTLLKCLGVVALTILTIVTIPNVFKVTYYESNRWLLQKESAHIAMLNLEKEEDGVEIGVYENTTPEISTKLLVKLDDIEVPWYDLYSKVMYSSVSNNLDDLYKDYQQKAPASLQEDVTVMNDGVYIYTDDIFNSADVNLDSNISQLYMRTDDTLTMSFYSPYYAILQTLTSRVNQYNSENNWYSYTTKTQKGGKLKTLNLITAYLTSTEFLDSENDTLDIAKIHGVQPSLDMPNVFNEEELLQMSKSLWTNVALSNDAVYERANKLNEYAREYVLDNKELLGKISDDTFLKVMALSIALKHNQLFGIDSSNCFEIYNLSSEDIMRMSVGTSDEVMMNSSLSYGRFIYEIGGTPAVYAAALQSTVNWLSSYVNPICTIVVFIAIFLSLFIFRICLRRKSSNLYGYILTVGLLCVCNLVHSVLLKLSMYLPYINITPTVRILIQVFIQIIYMYVLVKVTMYSLKDWQDLAFSRYQSKISKLEYNLSTSFGKNKGYGKSFDSKKPKNNWEYYDKLSESYKERNRN